jgi:hypothetical protein
MPDLRLTYYPDITQHRTPDEVGVARFRVERRDGVVQTVKVTLPERLRDEPERIQASRAACSIASSTCRA